MICKHAYIYIYRERENSRGACTRFYDYLHEFAGRLRMSFYIYIYIYMFVESCWLCVLMGSAGDDVQYNFGDINARGV